MPSTSCGVLGLDVIAQALLGGERLLHFDVVEVAVVHGEQRQHHFPDLQRLVLRLLHQFGDHAAALELLAGGFVEVGGELRERREFAILRERETHAGAHVLALHDLRLRGAADSRHRDTGVDGGTDAGVEQVGFQEDLAVGDRDHVGRHEGGHVAGLGFDDRQRGERAGLALDRALGEALDPGFAHARGAFEQTAVQIEHVAGIGFTAGRTAQQQRDLAVRPGLLGQVVIDDQGVLAAVAEVLAHGAAGVGRDVLHGGGLGGRGGHDDRVRHRAVLFELAHDVGDGRGLLADRDVHAEEVLALLVDDGVHRHRGLAGLAVADDQFALAAADRHHRIDRLEARSAPAATPTCARSRPARPSR